MFKFKKIASCGVETFLVIDGNGGVSTVDDMPVFSTREDVLAELDGESCTDPHVRVVGPDGEFPEYRPTGELDEFDGFGVAGGFHYWGATNKAVLEELIWLNPDTAVELFVDNWRKDSNPTRYAHVVKVDFMSNSEVRTALQDVMIELGVSGKFHELGVGDHEEAILRPLFEGTQKQPWLPEEKLSYFITSRLPEGHTLNVAVIQELCKKIIDNNLEPTDYTRLYELLGNKTLMEVAKQLANKETEAPWSQDAFKPFFNVVSDYNRVQHLRRGVSNRRVCRGMNVQNILKWGQSVNPIPV